MIRLGADNNLRVLIVTGHLDCSYLLSSDRQYRYQIQQCELISEALAIYQQDLSGCILLDWESSAPIDTALLQQITTDSLPVVILLEAKNENIVTLITKDYLVKETLTPELLYFAIDQTIAQAALKHKLAEVERKLHKYELVEIERKQPSNDFLLSIHSSLSKQFQKELRERQATENLLKIQNAILEKIAKGEELSKILDMLVSAIEAQLGNALCSILVCDRYGKLYHGSAPQLPESYMQAIDGVSMGEGVGSCGTTVFRKEPVIVPDIATDSLWRDYRELALEYGFRACWSFPIITSEGLILGAFGVYHREIYTPKAQELEIVSLAANIAGIALERDRAAQALQQLNQELEQRVEQRTIALQRSEEQRRLALDLTNTGSWDWNIDSGEVIWNTSNYKLMGLVPDEIPSNYQTWRDRIHPDDLVRAEKALTQALENCTQLEVEYRTVHPDGKILWVLTKGKGIYDQFGKCLRMIGVTIDISDRIESESQLEKISRLVPGAIYQFRLRPDGTAHFPYASERMHDIYGFTAEELREDSWPVFSMVHPEDLERLHHAIIISSANLTPWHEEYRICLQDGQVRWLAAYSTPERKPDGSTIWHGYVQDVSDRLRSEEALRQSETHQRALISAIPDLLMRINSKGIYLEFIANPSFRVMGKDELIGKHISKTMLPALTQKRMEHIQVALQTGSIQIYEHEISFDGITQIEEVRIVPYGKDEVLALVRDISDRKQAEKSLTESKQLLDLFFNNSLAGFFFMMLEQPIVWNNNIDKEAALDYVFSCQRVTKVNQAMLDQYRAKEEELVGATPIDICSRDIEQGKAAWRNLFDQGRLRVDTNERRLDGSQMWIEGDYICLYDQEGRITGHFGVQRDISDRKMAELNLTRSQEELNYHIENSPLATIRWDREFRVEYWSKQAEKIFGWQAEEILGKHIYECQLIFEDDLEHVQQVAEQLMKGIPQICQNRNYQKDGTVIHCEWFNSVLMDEDGNLISMLSLTQDVTKRKQIEIDIHQSQEALSKTAATLRQQMKHQRFIMNITQQIHQSLNIDEILTTSVNEIKRLLNSDRVVVFQFIDGVTKVVKEMVNSEYLSIIDMDMANDYFTVESINYYLNRDPELIVYASDVALDEYSEEFVKQADIKSQIVIPIVQHTEFRKLHAAYHNDPKKTDQLWGLLIVHACSQYRHWQPEEIDLLKQIANQLAIAIQQASLYEQVNLELFNSQQFERQLMNELNQKKVLLKEIHHRVKNNLQVMSSILYLQFRNAPSEIKLLIEEYQNRILSMSLIHEQLYRSDDLAHIDFHGYINNLTTNLFQCYAIDPELIQLEIKVEDIFLCLDQSIPLGLIINELVSNALKYAFPKKHGKISISLIQEDSQIILTVSDNGVGLPDDFDLENMDGLGMQLIQSLTEQLEGEFTYDGKNGLTIQISFLADFTD